ncbi:glycine betaine ABC transporter substrate-binding protein [Arthrobacter sp. ATA002]|uniref:glycine betaine ABC transporter substrate-binding protein n=1 Tax=Arthrobacter sp. ATA002 TaxID=2991715 RepID=UPI0022A7EED2|nr:glycine betaine ABC transporter substrate-binding protein [Arthrobacter sp. ATA002]WAP52264.1 glycine betaine ABC transporter substrate-binding protein [Arthrobacter sp. ATA002]
MGIEHMHSIGTNAGRNNRRALAAAGAAVVGLLLGGCGLQPAASYTPDSNPGSIRPIEDLPGDAQLTVVSKNFTEQLILGKVAVLTARAAGFEVTDLANVPGSQPVRELMLSGQADMAWEYTGSAWITYLGMETAIPDQTEQWQAVYDADLANGLTWGKPAPMNNTYAMAVRSEAVGELGGITKMSEIAALPVQERTFCLEPEFNSRPDGFNPMAEAYGIPRGTADGVPEENIGIYDTGPVYSATDEGACNFGEVFTTDGRIDSLDLTVLEDDWGFFPAYNGAPVFNTATLKEYPELEDRFAQVTPLLSDEVLRQLNLRVDVLGEDPADVAYNWMLDEGLITAAD